MYLNTLDVILTPRINVESYNVEINDSTLEILSLILEFKLATGWHLSRFLSQKDKDNYVYAKLHRMWRADLLESFKIFKGSRLGMPLYYMLSKQGLGLLADHGVCEPRRLKTYPKAKDLLSWSLFKHEAQIVELASLEILNKSPDLNISFKGEAGSQSLDYINDKHIEALTPDYTAIYEINFQKHRCYTEFERTFKSKAAILKKIARYHTPESLKNITLRLIFQTPGMEQNFWLNIFTNKPSLLRLKIVTTHLSLISNYKQFLEPMYASEDTVKLTKEGQLQADVSQRIKLFNFL